MIVFRVENKINGHNCCANGHHDQYEINQQHESINIVELVGPEGRKHKVHLDENRTKGKDTRHRNDEGRGHKPGCRWYRSVTRRTTRYTCINTENMRKTKAHEEKSRANNLPGYAVDTTRRISLEHKVTSKNSSNDGQGKRNEQPHSYHFQHDCQRNCVDSIIRDGNTIQSSSHSNNNRWDKQSGANHCLLPFGVLFRSRRSKILPKHTTSPKLTI